MKIQLYHGTSVQNADRIMKIGFRDRVGAKTKNWDGKIISMRNFIYLTRAYPFYFATNAANENDKRASVIKVEVDLKDLCPDEDWLRIRGVVRKKLNLSNYKHLTKFALKELGNVAIHKDSLIKILGRKDFNYLEMCRYSDPSISILNYRFCGEYYRQLTDKWWNDEDYKSLNQTSLLSQNTTNV
jgi:hypothetical protein